MNTSNAAGLTAIAAMIGSTLCSLFGDTAVKLAAEAVSLPQIISVRGALAAVMVAIAAAAADRDMMQRCGTGAPERAYA